MGSWRLKRQVDCGEEVVYKFTPKFVLKAGQSVTVRTPCPSLRSASLVYAVLLSSEFHSVEDVLYERQNGSKCLCVDYLTFKVILDMNVVGFAYLMCPGVVC